MDLPEVERGRFGWDAIAPLLEMEQEQERAVQQVAEPAPKERRRRSGEGGRIIGTVLATAVAVAMLCAAGVAGIAVVGGRDGDGAKSAKSAKSAKKAPIVHPATWDPRVTELVAFVERERGLTFKHPVRIDFLDEAAFRKEMTESDSPDEADEAEIKSTTALLRAVGYLSGDVDILAAGDELAGDGVIGSYDPEEKRVAIRGETIDDSRRATIVHELTHVLQDQHFGIGDYRSDDKRTSGEVAAHTAAIEADAEDVEAAWEATLPAAARDALAATRKASSAESDFKGVPDVFVELMGFPYVFGPPFLQAVEKQEGPAGRNRLLTEPPKSEEHILLPQSYLERQVVRRVKAPGLMGKEKAVPDGEGDIGMLSLLVMLAERLDFGVAWPAVQGWAGDAYVAFERDGATCVRASVQFDKPEQAGRFSNAFGTWAKGRPASHVRNETSVVFDSCDPGVAAPGRAEGHVSGIEGLSLREGIVAGIEGGPISHTTAECITDGLLERLTADRVAVNVRAGAKADQAFTREIQRNVAELVPGCR